MATTITDTWGRTITVPEFTDSADIQVALKGLADSLEPYTLDETIVSDIDGKIDGDGTITTITRLTQAAYDALTPVSTTLYVIVG